MLKIYIHATIHANSKTTTSTQDMLPACCLLTATDTRPDPPRSGSGNLWIMHKRDFDRLDKEYVSIKRQTGSLTHVDVSSNRVKTMYHKGGGMLDQDLINFFFFF